MCRLLVSPARSDQVGCTRRGWDGVGNGVYSHVLPASLAASQYFFGIGEEGEERGGWCHPSFPLMIR